MGKRRKPDPPPWRRFVVFAEGGTPTGWAMGVSEVHAIRHWLAAASGTSEAEIEQRWRGWLERGYSVRAVDLTLAPADEATPARSGAGEER